MTHGVMRGVDSEPEGTDVFSAVPVGLLSGLLLLSETTGRAP